MSTLDAILLAFIAGLAIHDLWPVWVRRAAEPKPKRADEPKRLIKRRR